MTQTTLYAITAPINALISCAFISLFMKRIKLKPSVRCVAVFVVYVLFAFVMGAGGYGLFNMNMANYNWMEFIFRVVAGFCVCIFLFLFYSRGEIAEKMEAKKKAKK